MTEEAITSKLSTKTDLPKESSRPKSNIGSPTPKSKAEQIDIGEVESRKIPKILATLEAMKQHMAKLRSSKMGMELKNYDARCYPYLLAVLALSVPELYSTAMQIILSTLDHFEACNDAYAELIAGILDLFAYHPSVHLANEVYRAFAGLRDSVAEAALQT